ncbi:hypothetical protein GCM10017779_03630 [Streptomyces capillispiralis]|nr:hypothetical protein GCM10017779_03630 [Streptomyces capillispiralis]
MGSDEPIGGCGAAFGAVGTAGAGRRFGAAGAARRGGPSGRRAELPWTGEATRVRAVPERFKGRGAGTRRARNEAAGAELPEWRARRSYADRWWAARS